MNGGINEQIWLRSYSGNCLFSDTYHMMCKITGHLGTNVFRQNVSKGILSMVKGYNSSY